MISQDTEQKFDYFLIMDFEATGDVKDSSTWEIIEFPCVILNARTRETEAEFREYVKPTRHKALSDICKQVTKISQETVDIARPLPEVLETFYSWIAEKNLGSFAVVTCGDYDLKTALYHEIKKKIGNPTIILTQMDKYQNSLLRPHSKVIFPKGTWNGRHAFKITAYT